MLRKTKSIKSFQGTPYERRETINLLVREEGHNWPQKKKKKIMTLETMEQDRSGYSKGSTKRLKERAGVFFVCLFMGNDWILLQRTI